MRLLRSLFLTAGLAVALQPDGARAQGTPVRLASTSGRLAAAPAVDSAIVQLQDFLQRYPNSPLRANALFQLGELLVRRADEQFANAQRAGGTDTTARSDGPIRANYDEAIARYEELIRRFPNYDQVDAAAYTLGTLYATYQRHEDAARMFEVVASKDTSRFAGEALFRLGDSYFEIAAKQRGEPRRQTFARAATAYEQATRRAPQTGANRDIYFLSLYKLGWSYYNMAGQSGSDSYQKAVDTFGQLVDAYDKLSPEEQNRLGLRAEAIEYMAVAFTQVGGAEAASRFFSTRQGGAYKLPVLRRVAFSLQEQGSFSQAIEAYRALMTESPTDSSILTAHRNIIDIYQNRVFEPEQAQRARLELVEKFAPNSPWVQANAPLADSARKYRETALREAAQQELATAQKNNDRAKYAVASGLYERYFQDYQQSDSARAMHAYFAEALFGQGEYMRAGGEYSQAAAIGHIGGSTPDSAVMSRAVRAGQNAIVAYDSALVRNKSDRATQDSLFAAVDRFVEAFPNSDVAKKALIEKGRRASETQRWDVMEQAFRTYAQRYPNDPYTPTAQRLIGDALFKGGQYANAQTQWENAQQIAVSSGKRALADSIVRVREAAAATFADTLIKQGNYQRAAEEVYVAFADKNPNSPKAPDALRDAIETYMIVVDSARQKNMGEEQVKQARDRAIELTNRIVTQFPTYRYRTQYQTLNARLLAEAGRGDEASAAQRKLIADLGKGAAQADAMIRLAVQLDSAGKKTDAAAAYAEFSRAYPTDKRAQDALYNAAITYAEAGDKTTAASTYAEFARRYPRVSRADTARVRQIVLLQESGDTTAATQALTAACASPSAPAEVKRECAIRASRRTARAAFEQGVTLFNQYQPVALVIPNIRSLNAAGVQRASARKQALLKQVTAQLTRAIQQGVPEYVAGGSYYAGLAQWEYGNFLTNVQLPADLTEEQRAAAQQGASRQAQQYYQAAQQTWQALIEKAQQDTALANDPGAKGWLDKAREAMANAPPAAAAPAQQPPAAGDSAARPPADTTRRPPAGAEAGQSPREDVPDVPPRERTETPSAVAAAARHGDNE